MRRLVFPSSLPEKMFAKALEYKETHGSTDIPEGEKGAILLRRWLNHQCLEHHNFDSLSSQQIEKLELELGHILPPSWEDMYDRLVVHRELSGTLDVNREDGEDELYTWVKVQKRYLAQHFQGKTTKLDIEKLTRLKDLGYAPSRPGTTQANGTSVQNRTYFDVLPTVALMLLLPPSP